jgi:hypothetical protein
MGLRPFVELKGGFINYMFDGAPPGFTSFTNQVGNLRAQNLNGALLAGGGLEGKVGRWDCGWMWEMRCISIMGRITG